MYALGVDLGTTFTAAGVWRDGRAEISTLGTRSAQIPSVVLARSDGSFLTGEAAVRRAPLEPDRVAREFKRRVGDSTPLLLGGTPHSAEALTARLLAAVVGAVAAREGGPPASLCISHPANWGPYKSDLLRQAARLADIRVPVVYTSEPECAAISYARQERLDPGEIVAVYDLGGGTFDAAVLRRTDRGFDILGQPDGIERLGGVDIDAAVFNHVARSVGNALAALDEDDPAAMAAVARLRAECTEAKEALSSDTDVAIPVMLPTVSTEVRLTRAELEDMVRPSLYDSIEALRRAVRQAGVEQADISTVLLVGGSSRMPLVAQVVGSELDRPVAVDAHPKHAIALGAAWVASGAVLPTDPELPRASGPVVSRSAALAARPGGQQGPGYAAAAYSPSVPSGYATPAPSEPQPSRPVPPGPSAPVPSGPVPSGPVPSGPVPSGYASPAAGGYPAAYAPPGYGPGPSGPAVPPGPVAPGAPYGMPYGQEPGRIPPTAVLAGAGAPPGPAAGGPAGGGQLPSPPAYLSGPDGGYRAPDAVAAPGRETSSRSSGAGGRIALAVALVLVVLAAGAGAYWWFVLRDSGSTPGGKAGPARPTASAKGSPGTPVASRPAPDPSGVAHAAPPPAGTSLARVTVTVQGDGRVSGAVSCAASCTTTLARGKAAQLHAKGTAGSSFTRWSGCTRTAGSRCTVVPRSGSIALTVTFTAADTAKDGAGQPADGGAAAPSRSSVTRSSTADQPAQTTTRSETGTAASPSSTAKPSQG